MIVTKVTITFGVVAYIALWAFALSTGWTTLSELLAIPLILAVIILGGVGFTRYMGLPPRQDHFEGDGHRGEGT